jgi:uncharacterized protein YoaH (UPF0181 family)
MTLRKKFLAQCERSIEKFIERLQPGREDFPIVPRGIWTSEAFALCAFIEMQKIDMLFESGIYRGQSTWILANYFDKLPISSVDIKLQQAAVDRLSPFSNVSLSEGDGVEFLLKALRDNPDKRIGVVIDGPKNEAALELAGQCLDEGAVFAGLHDTDRSKSVRPPLDDGFVFVATDDEEFVSKYGYLDEGKWDRGLEEGRGRFPYQKIKDYKAYEDLECYGPTLAMLTRRKDALDSIWQKTLGPIIDRVPEGAERKLYQPKLPV